MCSSPGPRGFWAEPALSCSPVTAAAVHATARTVPSELPADIAFHPCDLHVPAAVDSLFATVRPTHLLHLAWFAQPGEFWRSPENLRRVESSLRIVRAFAGSRRATTAVHRDVRGIRLVRRRALRRNGDATAPFDLVWHL